MNYVVDISPLETTIVKHSDALDVLSDMIRLQRYNHDTARHSSLLHSTPHTHIRPITSARNSGEPQETIETARHTHACAHVGIHIYARACACVCMCARVCAHEHV